MHYRPSAIIFDMDGVIVDSEPLNDQHMQVFLKKLGVKNPQTIKTNYKGMNSVASWSLLREEFKLKHVLTDLIRDSRQSYVDFLEALAEIPPIPGALELLDKLTHDGHTLALASSASPRRVELFLTKLKIAPHFSTVVHGDDIEHSKPAPDIFLLAAERLGVEPRDCVVVEDTTTGVRAARAAGMVCIGYGGSPHNLDDLSEAHVIIDDLHKFTDLLRK